MRTQGNDTWVTLDAGKSWSLEFPAGPPRAPRNPVPVGFSELVIPRETSAATLAALNAVSAVVPNDRHVVLEAPKESAKCSSAADWITTSPYLARATARVGNERGQILKRAANNRLVLLDFNFDGGHGAEVLSAARTVLNALGIPELDAHIERLDLNPAADQGKARDRLQNIFKEYLARHGRDNGVSDLLA